MPHATIAGCKKSIRHIESRFLPYFIYYFVFYAVSALTSGGFRIASDTFVLRPIAPTIYRPTYLEVEINSGVR